jgi:hypothetical protein
MVDQGSRFHLYANVLLTAGKISIKLTVMQATVMKVYIHKLQLALAKDAVLADSTCR